MMLRTSGGFHDMGIERGTDRDRLKQTMTTLQKMGTHEYTELMRVVFGLTVPFTGSESKEIKWVDPSLNDSQKEAIAFSLASRELALIWGPPGTGKTHTLIEMIMQMLKRDERVLVCGPSNVSVDNIVERLAPHKVPMVRLGHAARLLPSVLDYALDVRIHNSDAAALVRDIRHEMDAKQASIRKTKSGRERKGIYGELRELRKELRGREDKCVAEVISQSKVVLATLHGAGGSQLKNQKFDCVIIDEASQAMEAQCWIALLQARKCVLAGDHLQLPPTIKSRNSKTTKSEGKSASSSSLNLEMTLFERMIKAYPGLKRMLTTQYRMHETIMRFPADALYESKLVAADGTKRTLGELPYDVDQTEDVREPLVFFDTQGGDFPEQDQSEEAPTAKGRLMLGESKCNEMEVRLVRSHVDKLVRAGLRATDLAVITPYNAQVALLNTALRDAYPGIEIGSVDGFQGREKEAVIVSLVRSNTAREVGFLGEHRRLNGMRFLSRRLLLMVMISGHDATSSPSRRHWRQRDHLTRQRLSEALDAVSRRPQRSPIPVAIGY